MSLAYLLPAVLCIFAADYARLAGWHEAFIQMAAFALLVIGVLRAVNELKEQSL